MIMDAATSEIVRQIQSWLDYQEASYKASGMSVNDDTHIYQVPMWPSRGTFKNWIAHLKLLGVGHDRDIQEPPAGSACVYGSTIAKE